MKRLMLELAYDGGRYSGFVPQENAPTVGEKLLQAIRHIDPLSSKLTCSSRTDAGVHAYHQIVSFTTEKEIEPRGWALALQHLLPTDVCVVAVSHVPLDFDPRRDPIWKRYRYRVLQSPVGDPFLEGRAYRILSPLRLDLMRAEAEALVGEHDFNAFRAAADTRESTVRTLHDVRVELCPVDLRVIDIVVVGNRFLYNMVRIIAGTFVDVGRSRRPPGCCRQALQSGKRDDLGMTAPAAGLYLEHVELATKPEMRWPPPSPAASSSPQPPSVP